MARAAGVPPTADHRGTLTLPSGKTLRTQALALQADPPGSPLTPRPRHWLPRQLAGAQTYLDYYAPPSSVPPRAAPTCTVVHEFASRISIIGSPDMDVLGMALHHVLAIALTNPGLDQAAIKAILAQYPAVVLDPEPILRRARDLREWLAGQYPGAILRCELPFSRQLASGQMQIGQIDLALELPHGWILIDHKSNPQPKAEWLRLAAQHSGQLSAYAEALCALSGKPVLETLIHFSVSGGIVRLEA